ncbi:MAG: alpha/beta fold hydrolase [Oligoflexia bacterium]|nr:alpha/beta fold hydrolase [Oligoflexia bacterium]
MRPTRFHAKKVFLLHGFLGLPGDWDQVPWPLPPAGTALQPVPLLEEPVPASPEEWARRFCARVLAETLPGQRHVLLGYSMGGRLAMHALLEAPELFEAAVFVSASPGLATAAERETRLYGDEAWALRFEKDEWGMLLRDWDAQPIFAGGRDGRLERREEAFRRERLAACLRNWSVARQENLLPRLSALAVPQLWVAGERDRRYAGLLREAAAATRGRFELVAEAGHRVPWERPEAFLRAVSCLTQLHWVGSGA